jgi:hypothetical protein
MKVLFIALTISMLVTIYPISILDLDAEECKMSYVKLMC